MPNFSGIWTVTQQMQARGASTWPASPSAPTIGTATAGGNNCASVTFTAPACTGYPAGVTGYRVISTPGCVTQTGASSPLVVSGLTNGTSYTFKAQATNSIGYGALSAASNSITAALQTCATFTTAGTFSWVAPSGVTSVAVVAVGGGGTGWYSGGGPCFTMYAGAGGGLGYKNAQAVTPGTSYTVVVGAGGPYPSAGTGGTSYFISTCTVAGFGGQGSGGSGNGGSYTGTGGGTGGAGRIQTLQGGVGGGGAGGYSGAGGIGGYGGAGSASGSGGGGGGGYGNCGFTAVGAGAGGGVGLYGAGCGGAAGTIGSKGGKGGSGGGDGGVGCSTTGGAYGGGGGFWAKCSSGLALEFGSKGAVRIVWAGGSRGTPSFPSTNVGA